MTKRPFCFALLLSAVILAGCGGGGDSAPSPTEATTPPATGVTGTTADPKEREPAPELIQGARIAGGDKPQAFTEDGVEAAPGGLLQLRISVPASAVGKEVTVSVPKTTGKVLEVTTKAARESKTTRVTSSTDGRLKVMDVQYRCSLPPATFCPAAVSGKAGSGSVRLRFDGTEAPVVLNVPLGRAGEALPPVRLLPLGLPAKGAPVDAEALLRAVVRDGKSAPPAAAITAKPGTLVQAFIRPAEGSPRGGTLRIAIPKTSGEAIKLQAGGVAGDPAATATLKSQSGRLRIGSVTWSCRLPPGTFCPISKVNRTSTGLVLELPTPRVPIVLAMELARG